MGCDFILTHRSLNWYSKWFWFINNNHIIGHIDIIWSISYSYDNKYIASGSGDSTLKLWDASSYKLITSMQDNNASDVYSLAFSHDSQSILTANFDFSIKIWNISNYKEIF